MERLKNLLASLLMGPGVLKFFGGLLMGLSLVALILGARSLIVEQIFGGLQPLTAGKVTPPSPLGWLEQYPIIQAMIPETPIGFTIWLSTLIAGALLVSFGEDIERMY